MQWHPEFHIRRRRELFRAFLERPQSDRTTRQGRSSVSPSAWRAPACLRRDAERWIAEAVDGKVLEDAGLRRRSPRASSRSTASRCRRPTWPRMWRYHKPPSDGAHPEGCRTDSSPKSLPRVITVGRLDAGGLLLLTNDIPARQPNCRPGHRYCAASTAMSMRRSLAELANGITHAGVRCPIRRELTASSAERLTDIARDRRQEPRGAPRVYRRWLGRRLRCSISAAGARPRRSPQS